MLRWRYLKASFGWWFGLIWAFVGTAFAISGLVMIVDQKRFEDRSAIVTASVVEKGHETTKDGDSRHWIRYVYHDATGVEHVEVATVSWTLWRKYDLHSNLPIRYSTDNPGRSRIEDDDSNSPWVLPLIFSGIGLIFGGIGWFLVVRSYRGASRKVYLLRNGVGVLGKVTSVEMNMNVKINNRHPYFLMYEFTDDLGTRHEGESPSLPRAMNERWNAGDPILIVHDQSDPACSEPDIFGVRADEFAMLSRRMASA